MQRLVYTPRAYVFVKDQSGKIHDLTGYVTAGNVVRRIDQVSTAEITLRNPEMMFTAHRTQDGVQLPVFHPMDPITIFLRRVRGHPVRVFTGFLDRSPYLQLYPGTVTLKASCTLKRLLYTYFDPALPYTQSFLRTYGWTELESGVWRSFAGLDQYKPSADDKKRLDAIKGLPSGSISELLFATMKHIGGWNEESLYIEKLPDSIYDHLTLLAQEFQKDSQDAKEAFQEVLTKIVGPGSYGSGGNTGAVATGDIKNEAQMAPVVIDAANRYNIPAEMVFAVMYIETSFSNKDSNQKYRGWFQMKNDAPPYAHGVWNTHIPTYEEAHDLGLALDAFCSAAAGWAKADPSLKKNLLLWAEKTQGVYESVLRGENQRFPQEWENGIAIGKRLISKYGDQTATPSDSNSNPASTSRSQTKGGSTKSQNGINVTIYDPIPGATGGVTPQGYFGNNRKTHIHSGIDIPAPYGSPVVAPADGKIGRFAGPKSGDFAGGGMIHFIFTEDVGEIKAGTVIGWGHASECNLNPGDTVKAGQVIGKTGRSNNKFQHVHFIQRADSNAMDGSVDPAPLYNALKKGETVPTTGDPGSAGTVGSGDAGQGDSGGAAALFATLDLPGALDTISAQMLSGEKSLMNDKPLLPFVQQLCNAGLRQFQSLPDGKFYAFYPDYFGEFNHHMPYWEIDDIEILDGKVELDDSAVATHVYVVGDTTTASIGAGAGFAQRAVFSAGVVTVFNAFMSSSILERQASRDANEKSSKKKGTPTLLDASEAATFVERYGARPLVEDMPAIKSNFYEMFLAYQQFMLSWSRQFLTPFAFTFMPELYPGGKVGFPDHGLQMYIEEVTHSWDYTSGFLTQASLSAPSVYRTNDGEPATDLLPPNMVKGLIEPMSNSRSDKKKRETSNPPLVLTDTVGGPAV